MQQKRSGAEGKKGILSRLSAKLPSKFPRHSVNLMESLSVGKREKKRHFIRAICPSRLFPVRFSLFVDCCSLPGLTLPLPVPLPESKSEECRSFIIGRLSEEISLSLSPSSSSVAGI